MEQVEQRGLEATDGLGLTDIILPSQYFAAMGGGGLCSEQRLMLALLEKSLSERGGTYAMEDTDSMAIVATEHGGIIACPGGRERTDDGREGVTALSCVAIASAELMD